MSALMIAVIKIKDPAKFQQYLAETQKVAATYGAELLSRGKFGRTLTGETRDHDLTVIVKFPSLAKIDEWYSSPEYQPLIALRDEGTEMKMTSYEVMD